MSDEIESEPGEPAPAGEAGEAMHIHKPRSFHGLAEFVKEYGIIVLGVLTALALEQLVETFHWRHEVAETRKRLSVELATVMAQARQRAANSVCVERRLDELAGVVDEAARSGRLPPLGEPKTPMMFIWGSGVWQSAAGGQTAAHLGPGELMGYSDAYKFLARVDEANQAEWKVWTTLYGLAGPGRPFDTQDAATFRQAIGQARYFDSYIGGMGVRARQSLDAYGIGFDTRRYRQVLTRRIQDLPICKPIAGPPPADYGAAPGRTFVADARAHPMGPALANRGGE
ncbi:MAG TPA: hypothetical protein VG166_04145 [Caulobacteraceae bacterium]|nr:hypothetical protein [Caulobacteraceae bacterium]